MKRTIFILSLIVCTTLTAQSTWKADVAHSKVGFAISHLMISEVGGRFGEFDITANADNSFSKPDFIVEINTASIDTDNDRRDRHLKSDDFFGAETHPTITFKTTDFEKTGEKTFKLVGDLMIIEAVKVLEIEPIRYLVLLLAFTVVFFASKAECMVIGFPSLFKKGNTPHSLLV